MNYDIDQINKIPNSPKEKNFWLFDEFGEYIQKIQDFEKDYGIANISGFNIFSSISDKYHRENFHSDIIKMILDPKTEKIGSPKNIQIFVEMLKKANPRLEINIGGNVIVEREAGRRETGFIDILLYDDNNNAIIIENKINNARDQDDQIGRYYKYATKDLKRNVNAIVYLTPTPDKKPDWEYVIKNDKQREKIKELVIQIPAINKPNEISFSDDFIGKCEKHFENNIFKVYYSEYKELITHLGGEAVKKNCKMKMIKDIYKDREKLTSFNLVGSLWEERKKIIDEIIEEKLEGEGFLEDPGDPRIISLKLDGDVYLFYQPGELLFGFTNETKKISKMKNDLKKILDDKILKDIFLKESDDSDESYVYKKIDIDKIDILDNIVFNVGKLKKLCEEKYKQKSDA
jgi:hypothetical protein